ncbi:MAG: hypothetical protein ACRDPK_19370 [Carbonactinosporaceae bacterium]
MGEGIDTVRPQTAEGGGGPAIPRLADGVQLLGEYEGSGFSDPRYLVERPDQQMILVSRLLYVVAGVLDGRRDLDEAAALASEHYGQRLSADGLRFLIEGKLGPLGIATFGGDLRKPPRADPLLSLSFRGVLAPARVTRVIGALFAPLFRPAVIVVTLVALVGLDTWLIMHGDLTTSFRSVFRNPLYVLPALGLVLLSSLFHECGHAAGCHYGGAKPGAIGVGIYLIFPAFYTNVTDAYRLNRRGRLRTDLGGIYFNIIIIVLMEIAYLETGYAPLLAVIFLTHLEAVQQLLPIVRLDGYYILGDIVGVPNLFGQVRPILRSMLPGRKGRQQVASDLRTRVRVVVTAWVLIIVPTLMFALVSLIWRLPQYASSAWASGHRYGRLTAEAISRGDIAMTVLLAFAILTLTLPWLGLTALTVRTLVKLGRALARLPQRLRGLHARLTT